jgi:hypothetical protein
MARPVLSGQSNEAPDTVPMHLPLYSAPRPPGRCSIELARLLSDNHLRNGTIASEIVEGELVVRRSMAYQYRRHAIHGTTGDQLGRSDHISMLVFMLCRCLGELDAKYAEVGSTEGALIGCGEDFRAGNRRALGAKERWPIFHPFSLLHQTTSCPRTRTPCQCLPICGMRLSELCLSVRLSVFSDPPSMA